MPKSLWGVICLGGLWGASCAHTNPEDDGLLRRYEPLSAKEAEGPPKPVKASATSRTVIAYHDLDIEPAAPKATDPEPTTTTPSEPTHVAAKSQAMPTPPPETASKEPPPDASGVPGSTGTASEGLAAAASLAASPVPPNPPGFGTLGVRVRGVRRCAVKIDSRGLGRAPFRAKRVPAGTHRITVKCPRKRVFSQLIEFTPGQRQLLVLKRNDFNRRID